MKPCERHISPAVDDVGQRRNSGSFQDFDMSLAMLKVEGQSLTIAPLN